MHIRIHDVKHVRYRKCTYVCASVSVDDLVSAFEMQATPCAQIYIIHYPCLAVEMQATPCAQIYIIHYPCLHG